MEGTTKVDYADIKQKFALIWPYLQQVELDTRKMGELAGYLDQVQGKLKHLSFAPGKKEQIQELKAVK